MPIGDGTEALDTFYAYYRLPEDGYDVVVAGREARLYHTVLHEIPPNGQGIAALAALRILDGLPPGETWDDPEGVHTSIEAVKLRSLL